MGLHERGPVAPPHRQRTSTVRTRSRLQRSAMGASPPRITCFDSFERADRARPCMLRLQSCAPASKLDYLRDVEDMKRIKPSLAGKSSVVRGHHWFIVMLENYDDNSGVIRTKYSYITIFDTGG